MQKKAPPPGLAALAPTRARLQTNKCTKKIRWTKEEDELLFALIKKSDTINWHYIAGSFPNKSTQQVTERWEKVLNPELVKGSWTRDEDEKIVNFVKENGCKNWTRLSTFLPGRIGKQCRERWRNHLDPNIIHTMWTTEEDLLLMNLHKQHGNSWVKISSLMPGRSDNAIKNRWNSTLKKIVDVAESSQSMSEYTTQLPTEPFLNQSMPPILPPSMMTSLPKPSSPILVNDINANNKNKTNNSTNNKATTKNSAGAAVIGRNQKQNKDGKTDTEPKGDDETEGSGLSFVSPFQNLISPEIQKQAQAQTPVDTSQTETSPRATQKALSVEGNRQKFLVLLERDDTNDTS